MNKKIIFTFWEPQENIPQYIRLCMDTWNLYLPEYEIVILDYSNIDKWLGKKFFDKSLYKYYSLPKQADAIRCAVLEKHGGIWFDADTIIISDEVREFLNIDSEFVLIGKHIAFIKSCPHSKVTKKWLKGIKRNIFLYKYIKKIKLFNKIVRKFNRNFYDRRNRWDYLGNSILNKILENSKLNEFFSIDKIKNCVLPEVVAFPKEDVQVAYKKFYFENDYSDFVRDHSKGIVLLHNSWTPEEYKNMSKEEFLLSNNTIAKLLNPKL